MKEFELAVKIGKELPEAEVRAAAAKALGVKTEKVAAAVVVKRSLDALRKFVAEEYPKKEEAVAVEPAEKEEETSTEHTAEETPVEEDVPAEEAEPSVEATEE